MGTNIDKLYLRLYFRKQVKKNYNSVLPTLTLIMHIIYKLTNRKIER